MKKRSLNITVAREVMGWKLKRLRILEGYLVNDKPLYRTVVVRDEPPYWAFHDGDSAYIYERIPDFEHDPSAALDLLDHLQKTRRWEIQVTHRPDSFYKGRASTIVAIYPCQGASPLAREFGLFPKALATAALKAVRKTRRMK